MARPETRTHSRPLLSLFLLPILVAAIPIKESEIIPPGVGMPSGLKIIGQEAGGAVFEPVGRVTPQMGSAFIAVQVPLLAFAKQTEDVLAVIQATPDDTKTYYRETFGSDNPFKILKLEAEHWVQRVQSDIHAFNLQGVWEIYRACFTTHPTPDDALPSAHTCAEFEVPEISSAARLKMSSEKRRLVDRTARVVNERQRVKRKIRDVSGGTALIEEEQERHHQIHKRAIWAAGGIVASLFVGALNRMTIESLKKEAHRAASERKLLASSVQAIKERTELLRESVDKVMKDVMVHQAGTNNLHSLQVAMNNVKTTGLEIEHALALARLGKFDPGLITPKQLDGVVEEMKATAKAQQRQLLNPTFYNMADSPASYVATDRGELSIIGSFPVVLKTSPFHLTKYTGLPMKTKHGYVTYQLEPKYLAISADSDTFFTLTEDQMSQKCRKVDDTTLCDVAPRFLHRGMDSIGTDEERCLMAIKDSDALNMAKACAMTEAKAHDTVISVGTNQFAFFTVTEKSPFTTKNITISCLDAVQEVRPREVTLITLPAGCSARGSSARVYGKSNIKASSIPASYVMPPVAFYEQIHAMTSQAFELIGKSKGISWTDTKEQTEALNSLDDIGQDPSLSWWSGENWAGTAVMFIVLVGTTVMLVVLLISVAVYCSRRKKFKAAKAAIKAISADEIPSAAVEVLANHRLAARLLKQDTVKLITKHTRPADPENPEEQPLRDFNLQNRIHSGGQPSFSSTDRPAHPSNLAPRTRVQSSLSHSLANGNIANGNMRREAQPAPSTPAGGAAKARPTPKTRRRDEEDEPRQQIYDNVFDPSAPPPPPKPRVPQPM